METMLDSAPDAGLEGDAPGAQSPSYQPMIYKTMYRYHTATLDQ